MKRQEFRAFEPITAFADPQEYADIVEEEINSVPVPDSHWIEEKLTGLFTVDGLAYDVILENETLSWQKMEGQGRISNRGSKFKKKKEREDELVLNLKNVYGVAVKRIKNSRKQEGDGVCEGFIVYTYDRKPNSCKLKENAIFFQHPSDAICSKWASRIQEVIRRYPERPKTVLFLLQPYAGKREARVKFRTCIETISKLAGHTVEYIELEHNEHVKQLFAQHIKIQNYDVIAVMGGDGTTSKVIHHLLNKVQEVDHKEKKLGFTPTKCSIPIAVFPVGTVNSIAHSAMGVEDVYTAMIHMTMGHKVRVDVSAAFCQEKFHHWGFHSQYGFHGTVLKCMKRTKAMNVKSVEGALFKALSVNKLLPYELEIKYVLAKSGPERDTSHPSDGIICKQGCKVCNVDNSEKDTNSIHEDEVVELDPFAQSGHSDILADLSKENHTRWESVKGNYLSVGLFTTPGRTELSPAGSSKFTHLADGCMDLVLVHNVSRKDFVRFVRRLASSAKNQLDLPFVESYRVKEVIFHQKQTVTWKHKDRRYSEIDVAVRKKEGRKRKSVTVVEIVDDLRLSDSDESDHDLDDNGLNVNDDSDDSLDIPTLNGDGSIGSSKQAFGSTPNSSANGSLSGSAKDINRNLSRSKKDKRKSLGSLTRLSSAEKESKKRKEKQEKKERKLKEKDEEKSKNIWNLDWEVEKETDLHFVVYPQLVTFCGLGFYADAEPCKSEMSFVI